MPLEIFLNWSTFSIKQLTNDLMILDSLILEWQWLNTSTLILIRIDPDWDRSRDCYEMIPESFERKFLEQQRAYYRV